MEQRVFQLPWKMLHGYVRIVEGLYTKEGPRGFLRVWEVVCACRDVTAVTVTDWSDWSSAVPDSDWLTTVK